MNVTQLLQYWRSKRNRKIISSSSLNTTKTREINRNSATLSKSNILSSLIIQFLLANFHGYLLTYQTFHIVSNAWSINSQGRMLSVFDTGAIIYALAILIANLKLFLYSYTVISSSIIELPFRDMYDFRGTFGLHNFNYSDRA